MTVIWIIKYKYLVLLPLAIFQGSMFAMTAGFLIHLNYLDFWPVYAIFILGDFLPDTMFYYLGRLGNRNKLVEKYGSKFKVVSGSFPIIEQLWQDHPFKTMFFGKLATGLSTPILISAGLVKMPYKKFISMAMPTTLILYAVFIPIGYYLGGSYEYIERYIGDIGWLVTAALLIVFAFFAYINKYARQQLTKLDEDESEKAEKRSKPL